MAKINNKKKYKVTPVTAEDLLLGTQLATGKTSNFQVEDLVGIVQERIDEDSIQNIEFRGEDLPIIDGTVVLPSKLSQFENDIDPSGEGGKIDNISFKGEDLPVVDKRVELPSDLSDFTDKNSVIPDTSTFVDETQVQNKIEDWSIKNIETIAKLKQEVGKEGQKVRLLGYYSAGDKPELLYEWKTGLGEDDGGSVINSTGGRWEALFTNKEINVKDFGAKGDAINDDTENIQRAWNKANGYTVIMQGYFLVTKTLLIPEFNESNSIQMVIDGRGKLSGGGQPNTYNSGLSQILYKGEEGTECIISEANQTWVSFKTIFVRNISDRTDVDGIKLKHFKSNLCQELYVLGFRDNFRIEGDFYYTQFNKCSFSHATQNNFYAHGLANSALFLDCRFSNGSGVGFNGNRLGDEVNFENCYFEGNKGHGAIFRNTRLVNINKGYIEHNGYESEYQGKPCAILVTPYTNNNGVEVTLNINQAYIMTSDNTDVVCVGSNTNTNYGNIIVNITSCTIPQSNIKKNYDSADKTYLIRSITINKTKVNISNNNYQIIEDKQIMNLVSGILVNYNDIKIENDLLYYKYFNVNSTIVNKLSVSKIFPPHFNKTIGNTDNADSFLDIDDVDNTNRLIVRLFRFTRALFKKVSVYDGSNEVIYLDAQNGKVKCNKLGLGNNTEILNSTSNPEGSVVAKQGSICVFENGDNSKVYFKKTGTSNIGWEEVNSDTTSYPVNFGTNYTQNQAFGEASLVKKGNEVFFKMFANKSTEVEVGDTIFTLQPELRPKNPEFIVGHGGNGAMVVWLMIEPETGEVKIQEFPTEGGATTMNAIVLSGSFFIRD